MSTAMEIPDSRSLTDWPIRRLGDLCKIWGGSTPSTSEPGYWDGDIPWLSSKDIKSPRITDGTDFVTERAVREKGLRICEPGTVVVVMRSGVLAHTFPVSVLETRAVINQDLKAIDSGSRVTNEFIAWHLRSRQAEILRESRRDGTTVQSIQLPLLKQMEVPLPPPVIQEQLVQSIDEALDKVRPILDRLKMVQIIVAKFRRSVLVAACNGELTSDWRAGLGHSKSAADLVEEVVHSRAAITGPKAKPPVPPDMEVEFDIPASWVSLSIDSLSTKVVDGVHKTPKYVAAGIPFVTVRNLTVGSGISFEKLNYITPEDHAAFTARTKPERGDILITKDGTIGTVRVVDTDNEFSIFVSVALIKVADKRLTPYLELALTSPGVQERMTRTGTGLQHLVLRDLRQLAIPLPPLDEQAEIIRCVESLFALIDSIEARVAEAINQAERTTQAILTKAFRGELGVD